MTKRNTCKYGMSSVINRTQFLKILITVLVICIGTFIWAQDNKEDPVAFVLKVNGTLQFREKAGIDWKIVKKKQQPLYNGYQLKTDVGNKALIMYKSGTRVLVNENTELEITAAITGKNQQAASERTKLIIGEIYSKVNPRSKTYEVETPSSVASVRGTEFNSLFDNGEATFLVVKNLIEILTQSGRTVSLDELQMITVPTGQDPGEVTNLTEKQAEKIVGWTEGVEPIWELNIVPQGGNKQEIDKEFRITVWAKNTETKFIDNDASFELAAFDVDSGIIEFSTDEGKTWTSLPDVVMISNGQANLFARGNSEGSVNILAMAEFSEPAVLNLNMVLPVERKKIELKLTDPDGSGEKTIEIEFEKK